jgi:hypothetical protein
MTYFPRITISSEMDHIKPTTLYIQEALMCERCREKDKKDPSDYVMDSDNGVQFIITFDKCYIKSKDISKYSVFWSDSQNCAIVQAKDERGDSFFIEKFGDKKEAEEFLYELLDEHIDE